MPDAGDAEKTTMGAVPAQPSQPLISPPAGKYLFTGLRVGLATMLADERRYTLPVALANLAGEHVQDTELMMAGSVLTILPAMIVFMLFQRAYVRGILAGSVKG